jgi:hypothetical protein
MKFKQKILDQIRLYVCVLIVFIGFIIAPTIIGADDIYIEGTIEMGGEPAENITVTIENLDTNDNTTVNTDVDGYYSVNIEDLEWVVEEGDTIEIRVPGNNDELNITYFEDMEFHGAT